MDESAESYEVFGVGYEGQGIGEFISGLRSRGTRVLADVRLNPLSRKRDFNKRILAASLAEAGIGYWHLPELGNPKWNRAGFGGSQLEVRRARLLFSAMLSLQPAQTRLQEIADAARSGAVAVMCVEADGEACHRYVVLRELKRSPELSGAAR
jgi:uncharacterized protein (DUF488 family)